MNVDEQEFIYSEVYSASIYAGNSPENSKIKSEEAVEDFNNNTDGLSSAAIYIWSRVYTAEIYKGSSRPAAVIAAGIAKMDKLPGAIFVIDPKRESIAIKEASKLNIPVVALIDTNCDPEGIEYPVPGNDDAIRAIKLITMLVTDSIIEGRQDYLEVEEARRLKEEEEQVKEELKDKKQKAKREEKPGKKAPSKVQPKDTKAKAKKKESPSKS